MGFSRKSRQSGPTWKYRTGHRDGKLRLRDTVHLLLLKTTEIDTANEHMANATGPGSLRFAPQDLGIHGELQDVVLPDSLGAFRASAQLQLQYRGGTTRYITTKNPMIEVILFQQEVFATAPNNGWLVKIGRGLNFYQREGGSRRRGA